MKRIPSTIPAGQFKAECLAILDQVAETGQPVIVTKRGKPVAKLVSAKAVSSVPLAGSVTFHGNITGPILDKWDLDD